MSICAFCLTGVLAFADALHAASPASAFRLLRLEGSVLKWGAPKLGSGRVVSFAFVDDRRVAGERNCRTLDPLADVLDASGIELETFRAVTRRAMGRWSAVAGIGFVEVLEADAELLIGAMPGPLGIAFTDVSWRADGTGNGVGTLERSLICLDVSERWTVKADGDDSTRDLLYVMTHELGHAIGIDHPGRRGALMASAYDEASQAFTAGDAAAARTLYGPPRRERLAADPGH